jgi:putative hydrolase of the HAD superfamily
MDLPGALLLDLDDTILDIAGSAATCWQAVSAEWAPSLGVHAEQLCQAIAAARDWYWADPERNRIGRHNLRLASTQVVEKALAELGLPPRAAADIADAFRDRRDRLFDHIAPFPGAIEALTELRARAVRLALITNGPAAGQRAKLERFDLARFFECVLIEGEFGTGKPDERVYRHVLDTLCVSCDAIWSIGDDLERDIATPQRLGLFSIWVDSSGRGLNPSSAIRPDRIIAGLGDLLLP